MNVIIAGSEKFDDRKLFSTTLESFCKEWEKDEEVTIITGGTKGPNHFGWYWGLDKGIKNKKYKVKRCYPNWNEHGMAAGMTCNSEMMKICEKGDWCVIFCTKKDKRITDLIRQAKKNQLHVEIVD
jgi:hypothetical protein